MNGRSDQEYQECGPARLNLGKKIRTEATRMGYLKYLRDFWKKHDHPRELLLQVRREPATVRLRRPTRIDRARSLGYKPKKGVVIIRQRVVRGGKRRPDIKGGRRSAHSSQRLTLQKNYQQVAEERVARQFTNCEVLNSYKLLDDGKYAWYEVILLDRHAPEVLADKRLVGVARQHGRANRGKTSAGRKARGLRSSGMGSERR